MHEGGMGSDGSLFWSPVPVAAATEVLVVVAVAVALRPGWPTVGGHRGWSALTAPLGAFLAHRLPVSSGLTNGRAGCSAEPRWHPMRCPSQMEATVVSMLRGVRFDLWLRCVGKLRLASPAGSCSSHQRPVCLHFAHTARQEGDLELTGRIRRC